MIERWKNNDGSETILVMGDRPRASLPQRILGIIGKAFLVLLVGLFPLYLFIKGINGLATGKLGMWSRVRGTHMLYGSEAVGWSWMLIGFAIGFMPYVFRENLDRRIKWALWLAVTACFVVGVYRLLRSI